MTETKVMRERQLWMVVTAVLATSLAWAATVGLVLVVSAYGPRFPEALAVLRALGRVAVAVGRMGGGMALALLGATLALAPLHRSRRDAAGRMEHA